MYTSIQLIKGPKNEINVTSFKNIYDYVVLDSLNSALMQFSN